MPDRQFVLNVARLVVGVAWADGRLTNQEVNALKDLLFSVPDIRPEEWRELEIYIDSPVTREETDALLCRVLEGIRNEGDKTFVTYMLDKLAQADGVVNEEEKRLLGEIGRALDAKKTGIVAALSKLLKSAFGRRAEACRNSVSREERMDDYIKNRVYYHLVGELEKDDKTLDMPDDKLRKLCLAGGLMARVAAADAEISKAEKDVIDLALIDEWSLAPEEARLVREIACTRALMGLDYFRLTRGFFDVTGVGERRIFLNCLFRVAKAAGGISHEETEEIRKISKSLRLTPDDFVHAKNKAG